MLTVRTEWEEKKMDQCKIGQLIRQLRREKGLTQEELAERFRVSVRTVSRWETGKNLPDLDLLIALTDFFEVDLRGLLQGERSDRRMDQEMRETVRQVADYSGEEKRRLQKRLHLLLLIGTSASCVPVALSGIEAVYPAASFAAAFGQGASLGLLAVGTLLTSRYAGTICKTKQSLLRRLQGR